MQIEMKTTTTILLVTAGISIAVHLVKFTKPDDNLPKLSSVETTTTTTSSQIGTASINTTTTTL